MTSEGQQAGSGTPGWRLLTALAALVVAAHALVLQSSPAHLGISSGDDATARKPFVTRNLEPAPAVVAAPVAAVKAVKAVKAVQNTPKNPLNNPPALEIPYQVAPEIVANTTLVPVPVPVPVPPPSEPAPLETTGAVTPTQAAPVLPVGPQTTPVTAIRLPDSVRLEYKVIGLSKNLNYQASAELDWKTDGDSYQAMLKVSAFLVGSRSMTSVGKITGSGLAPTRFADKFRTELAAHFVPEKGKIIFSANTPDAPWIEGVQDRVSVFLQLGGMLAAKPLDFPPGSNITFLTIGPREADSWTFVIEAEESLDLMGAPLTALKLTRKPRKEFDQKVEIWFAPSLGYLPVRSRITQQNGDFIDQQLTGIAKT